MSLSSFFIEKNLLFCFLNLKILPMRAFLMAILLLMQSNGAMLEFQLGTRYLWAGRAFGPQSILDSCWCMFSLQFCDSYGGIVLRFIPPDNFNLALLTVELEFVKKGTKDEQVPPLSIYPSLPESIFILIH